MTYPIIISRKAIEAFRDDVVGHVVAEAFDEVAPDGDLIIPDVDAHVGILRGPLASHEAFLVNRGLLPPIMVAAGNDGFAVVGYHGKAKADNHGIVAAGHGGTATAGALGVAVACDFGTATVGSCGIAVAGDYGTATAGANGTAMAGVYGVVAAGYGGVIQLAYYGDDGWRVMVAHVGKNGILPDVKYRLDTSTNPPRFVRVEDDEGAGDGSGSGSDA